MVALAFSLFGLIVGSFLNVLVLRHGAKSLGGRSACMSCGGAIPWYDNIPVVSWFLLRGKCRMCGSAISIQYPLVEISTALFFGLSASGAPEPLSATYVLEQLVPACIIAALLIAIATYDIRHTIIPDSWAYTFAFLAILWGFFASEPHVTIATFIISGPLASAPLFILWLLSKGRWMGLGGAELALGIGWLLGVPSGIFAVFFAFILGACVGVPLLVFSSRAGRSIVGLFTPMSASLKGLRRFTMGSEIPFGPFLVASCIIVWLFHINGVELWQLFLPYPLSAF